MKNTYSTGDYTITTIYFDGQFWCALIEQCRNGKNFAGRYVFGEEPGNPRLLNWMKNEFSQIPLLPVEVKTKIRFKKLAENKQKGGIPKSLTAFAKARTEQALERKAFNKKRRKIEEKEKYLQKQKQKKERK